MIIQFELVLNLGFLFVCLANQQNNQRSVYNFSKKLLFYHDQHSL